MVSQDLLVAGSGMPWDSPADSGSEALLRDAARGDVEALGKLLDLHRERLRRMVAFRLDAYLASHLDASDIVQEALADAVRKLPEFSLRRPLPLYPWLHRLASERLIQARRRYRREPEPLAWADTSANLIVDRFVAGDPTPGHALIRAEERQRVRAALDRLADADREILIMRYLEDLSFPEIAAILDLSESGAKMRHLRALQRIRACIGEAGPESGP